MLENNKEVKEEINNDDRSCDCGGSHDDDGAYDDEWGEWS